LFTSCGDIASVGIIVDYSADIETYVVGTPDDIKKWAYNSFPQKLTSCIVRHKNKVGNLVKDINRLMKVKYELDEIVALRDILCNANMLCDGSCNSVLDELSQFYDYSEYANIAKNYIIYFLYSKFKLYQRDFNKKIGLSVKGNHDRAEKYIELFKADSEKILRSFLYARAEKSFSLTSAVQGQTDIFDSNTYKHNATTLYVANNSFITLLDI